MTTSSKPSILFLNRVFPPDRGATGRMMRDLTLAFAKDGWRVDILCASDKNLIERHRNADIRVHRIMAPLQKRSIWEYWKLHKRLEQAALKMPAHDIIVSMTDPPLLAVLGQKIAKKHKSAHIHWCQDMYPDLLPVLGVDYPVFVQKLLHQWMDKALFSADRIVTIGRDMAHRFVQKGIAKNKISVIPNWADLELLRRPSPYHSGIGQQMAQDDARIAQKAEESKAQEHKQAPSLANDIQPVRHGHEPMKNLFKDEKNPRFRILYAGSIGQAHLVEDVIEAAKILHRDNPEIEFVFVGDGDRFEYIAQQRAVNNLQNIRLVPFQPAYNLRELMESGDVHLVTMKEEAKGMLVPSKIYSAFAVGRPSIFIGPQDSEIAYCLNDFHAGEVVAPGDVNRLLDVIKRYRYSSEAWFAAQNGASEAGQSFMPRESMLAWLKRARNVLAERQKNSV